MLRTFFRPLGLIFLFLFLNASPIAAQQADKQFGADRFVRTAIPAPFPGYSRAYGLAVKAFYLPNGTILKVCPARTTFSKIFLLLNSGLLETYPKQLITTPTAKSIWRFSDRQAAFIIFLKHLMETAPERSSARQPTFPRHRLTSDDGT